MPRARLALIALLAPLWLTGCDVLGIETATTLAAKREAEGKALGGACRHAARSIEDCYGQNRRADKAAMFAGWREMNDYMRENDIQAMPAATPPAEDEASVADAAKTAKAKKDS